MKTNKILLGHSGKYYTSAELCIRNIDAQPASGNKNLITITVDDKRELHIWVKSKKGDVWPNCKGINQKDSFIVFVDFKNIKENQRPDFYIMDLEDWSSLLKEKEQYYKKKHPEQKIEIINNVLFFLDQRDKDGKPYSGYGVNPKDIRPFKEKWDKIQSYL